MSIHDWTKVVAGIFHDFHGEWIRSIKHALNAGILPPDYYALAEQRAAGVEPDVLALTGGQPDASPGEQSAGDGGGLLLAPPRTRVVAESDFAAYRRKQNSVVVRHASDDRVVAVVEVVSVGNKCGRNPLRSFVEKAADLVNRRVHLLVIDPHPPGRWDAAGIHGAVWDHIDGTPYHLPADKPLTLASYECRDTVRAYVEHAAVGDALPDMPLFLVPGGHVLVPLERTYQSAWELVPTRWRRVIEG